VLSRSKLSVPHCSEKEEEQIILIQTNFRRGGDDRISVSNTLISGCYSRLIILPFEIIVTTIVKPNTPICHDLLVIGILPCNDMFGAKQIPLLMSNKHIQIIMRKGYPLVGIGDSACVVDGSNEIIFDIVGLSTFLCNPYGCDVCSYYEFPVLYHGSQGICYQLHVVNFGEDISDCAIDFGVWPKSDNIRDHIAALNSKQSFMVEYIGIDMLICNHIKHAPLVSYWSREKSSWKFERLTYLAFGGLQGFAYNHKDLADAIHTFDVGHCFGNALVVTKIDSYEIHLAVLSTENYGIENWDLLQASFANNVIAVLKAWLHNIVSTMVGAVDCPISFGDIGQKYFRKFSISCHFNIGQQPKNLGNVEKINGNTKAELIKMVQKQFVLFFRSGREQQWDPGGYLSTSASASWSPFKVWDPGKKKLIP
jgi:hypothetical protein